MNKQLVSLVIRHILTVAAGIFISKGLLEPAQAQAIIDFIIALVGGGAAVGWSYKEKLNQKPLPHATDTIYDWETSPASLTPVEGLKPVNGFYFGNRSRGNLERVHPVLVELAQRMLAESAIDFTVIDGLRTPAEQKEHLKSGASTTLDSKHLLQPDGYAHAFDIGVFDERGRYVKDIAPYTIIGELAEREAAKMGIDFTWGGRWPRLVDASHFQLNKV